MGADWTLIMAVVAGLALLGVTGLTVLTGLRFQREIRHLAVLKKREALAVPALSSQRHAEIVEAEERLARLREEMVWLDQAKLEAEQHRVEEGEADLAAVAEATEARQRDIQLLESQRQGLTEEVTRIRDSVQRERHVLGQLNIEQRAAEQRRNEQLASIQEMRQRREALAEEEAEVTRDLKSHRAELVTLENELEKRRAQLQGMTQLAEEHARLAETVAGANQEIEHQRDALAEETVTLTSAAEAARAELARLAAAVATADERRSGAVAAVRELEKRREALTEEVGAINRATEAARADLARLREGGAETVAELELRRDECTAAFTETRQRHAALLTELEALERERQALGGRVATLRGAGDQAPLSPRPVFEVRPAALSVTPVVPVVVPVVVSLPMPALAPAPVKAVKAGNPALAAAKRPAAGKGAFKSPLAFLEAMIAPSKPAGVRQAARPQPVVKAAAVAKPAPWSGSSIFSVFAPVAKAAARPPVPSKAVASPKVAPPKPAQLKPGAQLKTGAPPKTGAQPVRTAPAAGGGASVFSTTIKAIDGALSGVLFGSKPRAPGKPAAKGGVPLRRTTS